MKIKQSISLLLIVLILSHGVSHFFIFNIFEAAYKKEIKQLIKDGFPKEKFVRFSFRKNIEKKPVNNFQWINKKEFRYRGEMYDIVKREVKRDSIYFECIRDVKETKLFANLEKHINDFIKNNPDKNDEFLSIINSLSKEYNSFGFCSFQSYSDSRGKYPSKLFHILNSETSVIIPPPKV